MTWAVWSAWLAIVAAPWVALAAVVSPTNRKHRVAFRALGAIWCLVALSMMALIDARQEIDAGNWFAIPALEAIAVPLRWTVSPAALWGIAASGLAVWWVSGTEDFCHSTAVFLSLICGLAAQAWFLENAWLLLAVQASLTTLGALFVGWAAERTHRGNAARSLWLAGAWADGVFCLAVLGAGMAQRSLLIADFANPVRVAELEASSSSLVTLIGLLWGMGVCGRFFQFPFSGVRDLAEVSPPVVNATVWGVALLPVSARWLHVGRAWWSANAVLTDLVFQWSAVSALMIVWCALASRNLTVRVTWLVGAQMALGMPSLMNGDAQGALSVEAWCLSLCAAAWLFDVLRTERETFSTETRITRTGSVVCWLAAANLCGIAIWPAAFLVGDSPTWTHLVHRFVWLLCGVSTVQIVAEARIARLSSRALWGSAWLIVAPLVCVALAGRTGPLIMNGVDSRHAVAGWCAVVVGILSGLTWQYLPAEWKQRFNALRLPLVHLGQARFLLPLLFRVGVELPVRGIAQAVRFLEWFVVDSTLLGTLRRTQRPSQLEVELQLAGPEFYALALGLTTAAVTLTVMWLAG